MADPFSAIIAAASFVFNSTNIVAQAVRFVGSMLITSALSGSKQPKLSDLKVQTSAYGAAIPRLYGTSVRVAGNVIDKSDLIPIKHKKGGFLGTDIGGVKYYTYDCHAAVLLCEGELGPTSLVRIFANGKVIFDRDAPGATAGTVTPEGGIMYAKVNKTQSKVGYITFYPGSATQGVDPTLQELHPGDTLSAYRHSAYVVMKTIQVSDLGGSFPNLEFEVEPTITRLGDIIEDLASFADAEIEAHRLTETVRGYIVAQDGTVWNAIEPLAGAFSFDLIAQGAKMLAVKRGRYMRTIIPQGQWAARPVGQAVDATKQVTAEDPNKYPDEVTVTYFDRARDYQPNTQRAFRNAGFSRNKINTELPLVLTADEARDMAEKALAESLAMTRGIQISVSDRYRWLKASDVVGLQVGDSVEPFRLGVMTRSPNGAIECEATYVDPLAYVGGLTGSTGNFPSNPLELPGETIMQPMDTSIVRNIHDNTGFYAAYQGEGSGWTGAEIFRALGIGSPITYEVIGNIGLGALMADASTALGDGPTDVWDEVNTLTVTLIGDDEEDLSSATEDEVLIANANLAWLGNIDGHDGEIINFRDVASSSPPGTYIISGLLRGRYGTEAAVSEHTGVNERLVMLNDIDPIYRLDFGAGDWNVARSYRSVSLPDDDVTTIVFTNTGRGKRPYAPIHLSGLRNGTNNDVLLSWTRRTRLAVPALGGGAVPLGEDVEAYEIDVYTSGSSPPVVARTLTSSTPSVNYTAAMLAADGYSAGDLIACSVYQMSGVFGRGEEARGLV